METKLKSQAINTELNNGWIFPNIIPTYASASTMTVPSGAASIYQKGDKVRFKQGAGYKYMYIIGVADTVLTLTGGSDYTVDNSGITDFYYSHQENPLGFPGWFNCAAPSFDLTSIDNGSGGQPTGVSSVFRCFNNIIQLRIMIGGTVLKVGTTKNFNFTIPATLPNLSGNDLDCLGSVYFGGIDKVGVTVRKSTTSIYFVSPDNLTDDVPLPSTNCDATYYF